VSEKRRYPLEDAERAAHEIVGALLDVTDRIIVAGSIRRRKPTVGDIEIVYIPSFETRLADLLGGTVEANIANERIEYLVSAGVLAKRPSVKGTFAWGAKNKLAVHRSGIPVDLFATDAASWANYLVCRTGPVESNIRIAEAAKRKGWKWNPYGTGFSNARGERHGVESEREVFEFVGLPYLAPEERK
jgi:DNA polymerase (family 10)